MTSRELVIKTLNHEPVPRVPRDLWVPSGEDSLRADELAEMNVRYPSDILTVESAPSHGKRSLAKSGKAGESTDAWGCVWHVGAGRSRGTEGISVGRRQPDRFLQAAGRIARPRTIRQGKQDLPDEQPVRAGVVGGSPFRPGAVASRPRGEAGGYRPRNEGDSRPLGDAARFRLQGTRASGGKRG